MNRFLNLPLLSILVLAGCNELSTPALAPQSDDLQRVELMDQRFNAGDFEYVVEEGTKYVQEYPNSLQGWSLLGWGCVKTDDFERAQQCFDKTLELNPKWDNAFVGKGVIFRKQGDNENARKSYLQAIALVPDNAEAFSSLLVIELMEGNDDKAIEYGEKAWKLRKDEGSIPANLAVAYHYSGNTEQRDKYYKAAEQLNYRNLGSLQDIFDGTISIR